MELIYLILASALSAMFTFLLHNRYGQGIVRASAIVGVVIGGFILLFPDLLSPNLTFHFPSVCIGMVSSKVLDNYFAIGFSGIIFTLLYLSSSNYIEGFGGSLGAAACISL